MNNQLLKILIVDDSPLVAPRIKSLLENIDLSVVIGESNSAEEALELMKEVVPDVVLLDINLPGKSGVALLTEIKHTYPNVMVIVFTNHADDHYRAVCKELGADYFFDKSSEFEMLPEALNELAQSASC
jgi:two-component system response regulator DevR